jgi:hypothetical protein
LVDVVMAQRRKQQMMSLLCRCVDVFVQFITNPTFFLTSVTDFREIEQLPLITGSGSTKIPLGLVILSPA